MCVCFLCRTDAGDRHWLLEDGVAGKHGNHRHGDQPGGSWQGECGTVMMSWWPCASVLLCVTNTCISNQYNFPLQIFLRVGGPDFLRWSKCVCVFIGWCECVSFLRPCLKFRWVCEIDSLRITCWVNDAFWASSMWTGQKLINGAHYQTAVKWHKPPYLQTDRQRNAAVDIMWL